MMSCLRAVVGTVRGMDEVFVLCGGNMFENNISLLQLFITAKDAKWSYLIFRRYILKTNLFLKHLIMSDDCVFRYFWKNGLEICMSILCRSWKIVYSKHVFYASTIQI